MFFNVGGYEILVIAVLALIFIGPEQLPTVMRKVGRYAAQMRGMAQGLREEFMSGLDEMPELKELTNLDNWTGKNDAWLGKGTEDDPVVPRGFAERERQREAAALESAPSNKRTAPDPRPDGGLNQDPVAEPAPSAAGTDGSGPITDTVTIEAVPTDAVPTDAVPIDAVPTDAVPTDAVPTDTVRPVGDGSPAPFAARSGAGAWNRPAPTEESDAGPDVAPYLQSDPASGNGEGAPA